VPLRLQAYRAQVGREGGGLLDGANAAVVAIRGTGASLLAAPDISRGFPAIARRWRPALAQRPTTRPVDTRPGRRRLILVLLSVAVSISCRVRVDRPRRPRRDSPMVARHLATMAAARLSQTRAAGPDRRTRRDAGDRAACRRCRGRPGEVDRIRGRPVAASPWPGAGVGRPLWNAVDLASTWPNTWCFTNAFGGGHPPTAYRRLADSGYDWGTGTARAAGIGRRSITSQA